MRVMKDSRIEWIGEIPKTWEIKRLKYVAELSPHCDFSKIAANSIIEYLPMEYIKKGFYISNTQKYSDIPTSLTAFQSGDIVFAKVTPCFENGNIAIIGELSSNVGLGSSELYVIRTTSINRSFMFYWLQNSGFVRKATSTMTGMGGLKRVSSKFIYNSSVVCPPIAEQIRIAAYLDTKCSEIDALVADIQKQIDTLEEYKRSVITEAVTKGLDRDVEMMESGVAWIGGIPEHWNVYRIASLYEERNERGNDELPLLSVSIKTGVSDSEVSDEDSQRIFVRSEDRTKYKRVYPQDLTYNMMRAWQGAFGAVRVEGMVSPAYVVAKPKIEIESRYMEALLRTPSAIQEMHRYSYGVADFRLRLYWDKFRTIRVCYPPLQEQKAIADYIDDKVIEIDSIISEKKQQIATIEEYKKSLIFEYVTGKKIVTTQAIVIDPRVILAGIVLSKLGANLKGKIQVQKIMFLCETMLGLPFQTQYFRYPHGPYDKNINTYFTELNSNQWFIIQDGSPMTCSNGSNFSDFENEHLTTFSKYTAEIERIIKFIAPMKTSQAERIATLFAVWNDLIIDGINNPSDEQIINEVITN